MVELEVIFLFENIGIFLLLFGFFVLIGFFIFFFMEEGMFIFWIDFKLVFYCGEFFWRGDFCERSLEVCFGVGLLGWGLIVVEVWDGVGFVGWMGVGVLLLVVCVGVGLVGFMLLGVVFGLLVGREVVFLFVV